MEYLCFKAKKEHYTQGIMLLEAKTYSEIPNREPDTGWPHRTVVLRM